MEGRDAVVAERLHEAQVHLGKTNAEMEAELFASIYGWAEMKRRGSISMINVGRLARMTGWTVGYLLGETDAKDVDMGPRGIMCGPEGCRPYSPGDLPPELEAQLQADMEAAQ